MPLLPLALLAFQAPTTLEAYLKTHPPAAPWLAIDASHVTSTKPTDLAAFGRKAVRIGEVTAIVPQTMVVTPDLAASADADATITRRVRLLTLMASLDDAQRRKMAGGGIGLSDLGREQRPLFESLLPRPLRWRSLLLADGRVKDRSKEERGTLSDVDRTRVRIRTFRTLRFEISKAGTRSRYSLESEMPPGLKGKGEETWYQLDMSRGEEASPDETRPNAPKPSGLRAASLSGSVVGPRRATVGALLAGAVRSPEILADRRVASLEVALSAGSFRVAELLPAVALAVTGTYRPVGGAYLLASDLEGSAARWARNQTWLAGRNTATVDAESELYETLRASGGLRAVEFQKDDPLALPEGSPLSLDAIDPKTGQLALVSVDELPSGLRAELDRLKRAYPDSDDLQVGLASEINFHFVFPNGKDLMAESPLQAAQAAAYAFSRAALKAREASLASRPAIPAPAPFALPEGNANALILTAESQEEADSAGLLARSFGFGELWLETHRPEVLARVPALGLSVRLVIRPWAAAPGETVSDPDRTLAGETASARAARMAASPPGMLWIDATPGRRELVAPINVGGRLARLAALARTPGLTGVVLLDAVPAGYVVSSSAVGIDANGFGYSGGQRLAFLRAQGLDPVDVLDPRADLYALPALPFFPIREGDAAPAGLALTRADAESWRRFRSEGNGRAIGDLTRALQGLPLLVPAADERRRISQDRAVLRENPSPEDLRRASSTLRRRGEGQAGALDLSGVPAAKWAGTIAFLLRRRSESVLPRP